MGEVALRHLERRDVDLAILDIRLKDEMSGVDVAQAAHQGSVAHVFIPGSGDPSTR